MKFGTWLAIYFIVWWTVLFAVLPIGMRTQHDAGEVTPGTDPGAPVRPQFLKIIALTSVIAAAVFAGLMWLIENYWMI